MIYLYSKHQLSSSTEAKDSKICRNKPLEVPANKIFKHNQNVFWILLLVVKISTLNVRPFQIFDLTIYACIFRHFVEFIYASLPSTNDCQKSVCHFTDAKIQYAFLHKMPFYTTAFLHYCLLTPLPIYTTAFLHYCQYTGEPSEGPHFRQNSNLLGSAHRWY